MGKVIMSCNHEAVGDEWMESWWWKDSDGESVCCGSLCPKCVPLYRAVKAYSVEEARELLKDDHGVTLQDICASWEGAERRTEVFGGIPFDIVSVPPQNPK